MTKLDAPNCKVRVPLPLSTYVPFRGNKIIKVQVRPHINVLYNKIYHIGLDYFVLSLCYIRNRKKIRKLQIGLFWKRNYKIPGVSYIYIYPLQHMFILVLGSPGFHCTDYSFLFTKTNLCSVAVGFAFDIMWQKNILCKFYGPTLAYCMKIQSLRPR